MKFGKRDLLQYAEFYDGAHFFWFILAKLFLGIFGSKTSRLLL